VSTVFWLIILSHRIGSLDPIQHQLNYKYPFLTLKMGKISSYNDLIYFVSMDHLHDIGQVYNSIQQYRITIGGMVKQLEIRPN
jgi:hypothetical protein